MNTKSDIFFPMLSAEKRSTLFSVDIKSKKVKVASRIPFLKVEKEILRDICFDINEGTLVALIGTAGSGKSTLAQCIYGQDVSGITGHIQYRGVSLAGGAYVHKSATGYFANFCTFRDTIRNTLSERAQVRYGNDLSSDEIRYIVYQTMLILDLNALADVPPSRLNGYDHLMLALGCELINGRSVIFLDDFAQGLRPSLAEKFTAKLKELSVERGITFIVIPHDLAEIAYYDQLIILGKVNEVGRQFFTGSVCDAIERFGVDKISEIFPLIESTPEKFISI